MNNADEQYHTLLREIISTGIDKADRTGIGTLSTFGKTMRFKMSEGYPLLTTKRVWHPGVIHELLWFLSGNTNIRYLKDNKVKIWDGWASSDGDLGPIYGKQWVAWGNFFHKTNDETVHPILHEGPSINQIQYIIDTLLSDPDNRRLVVSAWNVSDLDKMALPPCHYSFQFYSQKINSVRHLSMLWNQRSVDIFLGLPFNIASYALLLHMVAHVTKHIAHELIFNGGDVHIYKNHLKQVNEQLTREAYKLPTLELNKDIKDIFAFKFSDVVIKDYKCHKTIKAPIAI